MSIVLDARTATPHFPGIGRYVTNLARALIPLLEPGQRLTLLHDPVHPLTLAPHKAVQALAVSASPFSLSQQWAVPRLLRHLQADLYHSSYYLMPYRPGVAAVLTVYDLIPILFPEHSTARARLLFRLTTTLAMRASRRAIAISAATRQDLLRHFSLAPERTVAVPLAAGPAFYPQSPEAIADIRARLGLPQQYVLYLGSNKPHKNLVRLIEAWKVSNIKYQISNTKLVIAGHWDARYFEVRKLVEKSGLNDQVIFMGPVNEVDLPALYSGAELFVFPSLYEGFGLPVLEAMACGTPVVCSNKSSLPEVTGPAEILVDPLNVDALAEAIAHALADKELRQDLREKGLAQAARFSWDRTARETLAVYDDARTVR